MEVVVQSPTMDNFDFGGAMSSPYLSAPSSPKRFGEYNYLSAPASPSRLAQFYSEFDYFSSSTIPIEGATHEDEENGFAFFVNRESEKPSRSAEELFDGGKIKPLNESFAEQRRGRDRERDRTTSTTTSTLPSSNSGRRVTRSHSPYRKSSPEYTWQLEQQQPRQQEQEQGQPQRQKEESSSTNSSSKSSRRWRLRDFLLFRSASEGRASSKDPLKKYYKKGEEVKGSSFRSSDSHGSRRRGQVSAHEFHYSIKRAESQDLKKRTYLPYKQGILGRLAGFGF